MYARHTNFLKCDTARSREGETRNGQRNAHRNPEWCGDFSLLQIQFKPKSRFEFVPRDTSEFKSNQNLSLTWYREILGNLIISILAFWLKSSHHSGFWCAFLSPFRVSSSRDRAVKGWAEIFFPTPIPKTLGGPGGPTHPPPHLKRLYFHFWRQNSDTWCQNSNIYSANSQIYSVKTQICSAGIQIFDPKFKYMNFVPPKTSLFLWGKLPTPTHPPISVSQKLKRPPFAGCTTQLKYDFFCKLTCGCRLDPMT